MNTFMLALTVSMIILKIRLPVEYDGSSVQGVGTRHYIFCFYVYYICFMFILYMFIFMFFPECTSSQLRCTSGQCVSRGLMCNGQADCKDNSDEGEVCGRSCRLSG